MAPGSVRRSFHWARPSAGAAARAGLDLLKMLPTASTNDF